ncbi:hypothetical protein FD724_39115 (plasmid) [Nostoc sp. C057]|uniref:hypothetical protein n=1 Tax=Nostoc sp. C057 TaxID=2576903 RepID=UPI0015C2F1B2|nr:hypothetical protein [Nostoc sp. C057]QLE53848.1 hypothetical protein FD724_39115 [Nostoc sp. C057]
MNKLKKISILTLMSLILSAVPLLQANATSTKQRMQVWVGNNQGQTIDQDRSFVVVTCDTTGMVNVVGHLHKTNQISKVLKIAVKKDASTPFAPANSDFTTDTAGNGNFSFTLTGFASGKHDLVVEIQNYAFTGVNLYFNEDAANGTTTYGVPFICPAL